MFGISARRVQAYTSKKGRHDHASKCRATTRLQPEEFQTLSLPHSDPRLCRVRHHDHQHVATTFAKRYRTVRAEIHLTRANRARRNVRHARPLTPQCRVIPTFHTAATDQISPTDPKPGRRETGFDGVVPQTLTNERSLASVLPEPRPHATAPGGTLSDSNTAVSFA